MSTDKPFILGLQEDVPHIDETAWVAPGAHVVGQVEIGAESSVWYGVVVRADREIVRIGKKVNIQDLACLHSDPGEPVVLEDGVSVGHQAVVHGAHIGAGALIGIGAIVLGGAQVGSGALVAAGALVRPGQVIPAGYMAAGVPARVIRELAEEERETFAQTAETYAETRLLHANAIVDRIQV